MTEQDTVYSRIKNDIDRIINRVVEVERGRIITVIEHCLLFDNQRAVSFHEVKDCIATIRKDEVMNCREALQSLVRMAGAAVISSDKT